MPAPQGVAKAHRPRACASPPMGSAGAEARTPCSPMHHTPMAASGLSHASISSFYAPLSHGGRMAALGLRPSALLGLPQLPHCLKPTRRPLTGRTRSTCPHAGPGQAAGCWLLPAPRPFPPSLLLLLGMSIISSQQSSAAAVSHHSSGDSSSCMRSLTPRDSSSSRFNFQKPPRSRLRLMQSVSPRRQLSQDLHDLRQLPMPLLSPDCNAQRRRRGKRGAAKRAAGTRGM